MLTSTTRRLASIACVLLLAWGCGGSGGSSPAATPTTPTSPTTPTTPGAFTASVAFAPVAGTLTAGQGILGAWGWSSDILISVTSSNAVGGLITTFSASLVFAGAVDSSNNFLECTGDAPFGARVEGNTSKLFTCNLFAQDQEQTARPGETLRWVLQVLDDSGTLVTLDGELPTPTRVSPPCEADANRACLLGDRFQVTTLWGDNTTASTATIRTASDSQVIFYFSDPNASDMAVRMIDACGSAGFFQVSVEPGSTMQYEISVLDTATGAIVGYLNEPGDDLSPYLDDNAFATCS